MKSLTDKSVQSVIVHPHVWAGLRHTITPLVSSLDSRLHDGTINLQTIDDSDLIAYVFDVRPGQEVPSNYLHDIQRLAGRAPVLVLAPGLTFEHRSALFAAGASECIECAHLAGVGAAFLRAGIDALARRKNQHLHAQRSQLTGTVSNDTSVEEILELRRRNQKLQEFVGLVAHDLRVPLDNIVSLANYLADPKLEADPQAVAGEVHDSGSIALDLVNDLLDLTAIETGLLVLDVEPFDVEDFLQHVVRLHENPLRRKSLNLEICVVENTTACGDRKRISQVLHNLISNAIKFTPVGGKIVLNAKTCQDGVRIEVADSGIGIDAGAIPRLFDKFEKVSTPGTDGEAGTGFGLPLSQEIVLAHGSSLAVESSREAGTSFWFFLPNAVTADSDKSTVPQTVEEIV